MNWQNGFFRLWLLLSVIWIAYIGWTSFTQYQGQSIAQTEVTNCLNEKMRIATAESLESGSNCFPNDGELYYHPRDFFLNSFLSAFLLPVGLLSLGIASKWVLIGFKKI